MNGEETLGSLFGQKSADAPSSGLTLGQLLGKNQQSMGQESQMSQPSEDLFQSQKRSPSQNVTGKMVDKGTALVDVNYPDETAAFDDLIKDDLAPAPTKEASVIDRFVSGFASTEQGKVNILNKRGIPAVLVDDEAHYPNGGGPIDKTAFDVGEIFGDIADLGGDALQVASVAGTTALAGTGGGLPGAVAGMAAGEMIGEGLRSNVAKAFGAGPGDSADMVRRATINTLLSSAGHMALVGASELSDLYKKTKAGKLWPILQTAKVSEATDNIVKEISLDIDIPSISKELMEQNSAVRLAKGQEVSKMKEVALGLAGENKLDDSRYLSFLKKKLDSHNVGFDREGYAFRNYVEVPPTIDETYGVPKFGLEKKQSQKMAEQKLSDTPFYYPDPTEKMLTRPPRLTEEVSYPVDLAKDTKRGGSKVVGYSPAEFKNETIDTTKDVLARQNLVNETIEEYNDVLKAKKTYNGRSLSDILATDVKMEDALERTLKDKYATATEKKFRTEMANATRDHKDNVLEWLLGNDPVYDGKVKAINADFANNVAKLDAVTNFYETAVNKNGTMLVRGVVDNPQNHEMLNTLFEQMSPDQFNRFRGAYLDDVITKSKVVAGYTDVASAYSKIKNLPKETKNLLFKPEELRKLEKAYIDFDKIDFKSFKPSDRQLLVDVARVGISTGVNPEAWSRLIFNAVADDAHAAELIAEKGIPALAKMARGSDERIYTRTIADHFKRIMNYAGRTKKGKAQRLFLGPEARSFYLSNINKPTYDVSADEQNMSQQPE